MKAPGILDVYRSWLWYVMVAPRLQPSIPVQYSHWTPTGEDMGRRYFLERDPKIGFNLFSILHLTSKKKGLLLCGAQWRFSNHHWWCGQRIFGKLGIEYSNHLWGSSVSWHNVFPLVHRNVWRLQNHGLDKTYYICIYSISLVYICALNSALIIFIDFIFLVLISKHPKWRRKVMLETPKSDSAGFGDFHKWSLKSPKSLLTIRINCKHFINHDSLLFN